MKCVPSNALHELLDPERKPPKKSNIPEVPLARSIEEGLDYLPWWRSLVANQYFLEHQKASNTGAPFAIPASEDDQLVIDYFTFKAYGICADPRMARAIQWCERNHFHAGSNMAKIRAMIVAGCPDDEIAGRFFTCPENIAVYAKIFFDIRPCLRSPHWMDSFIKPETADLLKTQFDLEEVIWLSFGYQKGPALLDIILSGKINYLPAEESDEFWQISRSVITAQGLNHAIGNLLTNICGRSTEWERSLAIRDSESKAKSSAETPSLNTWEDWFNRACDLKVFSPDIATGIKKGEKAFIDIVAQASSPVNNGGRTNTVIPARHVASKLMFETSNSL